MNDIHASSDRKNEQIISILSEERKLEDIIKNMRMGTGNTNRKKIIERKMR